MGKDRTGKRRARKRRKRHERSIAGGIGAGTGVVVGGFIGGPPGAAVGLVTGAALGPELEPLVAWAGKKISAAVRRRQARVLAETGIPEDELREKIDASERAQLLTGFALNAAARTTLEGKLRTLGRSLASGLLAEDDATIDSEQMIVEAIADIEGPQLAMLELLVAWRPGRNVAEPLVSGPLDLPRDSRDRSFDDNWDVAWREWSPVQIAHARPKLAPLAPSLLATLQRHGLVVRTKRPARRLRSTPRRSSRSSASSTPGRGALALSGLSSVPRVVNPAALAPERTWSPTELGEQVFLRFRDAGTALDDVWSSGPAKQQDQAS